MYAYLLGCIAFRQVKINQKTEQGRNNTQYCKIIINQYFKLKKLQIIVFSLKIFPFICSVRKNIPIVHDKYRYKKKKKQ